MYTKIKFGSWLEIEARGLYVPLLWLFTIGIASITGAVCASF